jgi:iron-sulfur cluster insertion protein
MISTFDPNMTIKLTQQASEKIKSLLNGNDTEYMRIYIMGGGCSGFQYMFDIVKDIDDDDLKIDGSKVVIDPLSYQYLVDSEIDYVTDIMGSKFSIKNPQATTTCGCGQSFMV